MLEAVLGIVTPPEWKKDLMSKYHAKIEVIDCMPCGMEGGRSLVSIEVDEGHIGMAMEDVRGHESVVEADLEEVGRGRIKGVVQVSRCLACCRVAAPDTFLLETGLEPDGTTTWRLIAMGRSAVSRVISALEERGCVVELRRLGSLDPKQMMSSRQEDVLQIAYERGYFDYPKRVSLRELAAMFDISISTLSEMLRKGQRRIMNQFFAKRRDGKGLEA